MVQIVCAGIDIMKFEKKIKFIEQLVYVIFFKN